MLGYVSGKKVSFHKNAPGKGPWVSFVEPSIKGLE